MRKYKMPLDIRIAKELLSPPGDTIEETIESYNLTRDELASRMGLTEKTIVDIIKAKTPLTQDVAIKLERILNIPAVFWLKREADYQMQLAEIQEAEFIIDRHT